jgi:hypothetical protein
MEREQDMNRMVKMVSVSLLAFSSVLACSTGQVSRSAQVSNSPDDHGDAHHTKAGSVTRLMTQDLPDLPGKEGMIESSISLRVKPPRCIGIIAISSSMCLREVS